MKKFLLVILVSLFACEKNNEDNELSNVGDEFSSVAESSQTHSVKFKTTNLKGFDMFKIVFCNNEYLYLDEANATKSANVETCNEPGRIKTTIDFEVFPCNNVFDNSITCFDGDANDYLGGYTKKYSVKTYDLVTLDNDGILTVTILDK